MFENNDITTPLSKRRGLGASLRLVYHLYGKLLQRHLAGSELSMAQYVHLRTLKEEGPVSQSELSARMGIEKASSTRVLDELAQKKLISRERHQKDRRMIIVSLTGDGRRKIDHAMNRARSVANLALEDFEEEELLQLYSALDKLIETLSSKS